MFLAHREAVLSLGSNLGNREQIVRRAIEALRAHPELRVTAVSSLWESPSWKPEGEGLGPDYINAIVLATTAMAPTELLHETQALENAFGRERAERYADRTLDVDIVAFGIEQQTSAELTLPHPRAHERAFVLHPWTEVDANAELPGHGSVAELAEYCDGDVWLASNQAEDAR
ncbi:2-amino-4-hydroxy-6-hydroxymethyldihydropteridine diphosphokinase [Humidisolicoccus flavus]|uniref:2-amino-4-hydroxy-6- hydroxymethyldihydropteridine diphosphokinase n=1 Tax=Humidisolicoccus flavus TaxID=3111414 RepID=UPI003252F289